MEILHQIGELVLGSVPTIVLFLLSIALYRWLVYNPLHRVLDKRRELTTGAMEQARQAITTVESKTAEYEGRLRLARNGIQLAREHRKQQWGVERDEILGAARERAQLKVRTAKLELEQDSHEARVTIEQASAGLADRVLEAVLPAGSAR
jgi:F-type H+-transporting ATPase subunit b